MVLNCIYLITKKIRLCFSDIDLLFGFRLGKLILFLQFSLTSVELHWNMTGTDSIPWWLR